jgi:glycosyltransferase involved in cell wall biosynthesis
LRLGLFVAFPEAAIEVSTGFNRIPEVTISDVDTSLWEVPSFEVQENFSRRTRYALVIPVLNEGNRIRTQIARMEALTELIDTVLVDGGSTDQSIDAHFFFPIGVRTILVKTGFGKQSAQLRIGLSYALKEGYAGAVLMDGNNKDNPMAIPEFIRALDAGYDHIQGSRFIKGGCHENTPLARWIAIRCVHAPLISVAARTRFTDSTNGFKAYSKRLLLDDRVKPFREVFSTYELHPYLQIRAARIGLKLTELPVERRYPKDHTPSKITAIKGNLSMLRILFNACFGTYNP